MQTGNGDYPADRLALFRFEAQYVGIFLRTLLNCYEITGPGTTARHRASLQNLVKSAEDDLEFASVRLVSILARDVPVGALHRWS